MRKQCAWWECKKWFKKKHNCQKYCCVACQDKAIAEKKRQLRAERSVPENSVAIFWIAKISNFEEPDKVSADQIKRIFDILNEN